MIGLLILLIFTLIEIILLFLTMKRKTLQYQLKKWIIIISLVMILLLLTWDFLQIGFRYYGIVILLMILILKYDDDYPKAYQKSLLIKKTVGAILIYAVIISPAIIFPQYDTLATTGFYDVQASKLTYIDTTRIESFNDRNEYRNITLNFWHPKASQEKYPLIVFSHGAMSLPTSNESLYLELASHGYVVVSIGHPYHSLVTKDTLGNSTWISREYMKELSKENAAESPEQSYELYQKWMQLRTDDIDHIIDEIKNKIQNDSDEEMYNLIDITNIGVIGHSLGGSAALCSGRSRNDVRAVIALESPFMCDIIDATEEGFIFNELPYPTPVLNIYSDSAWNHLSTWPQYAQNYHLLTGHSLSTINIHISGAGHLSLTDLSLSSPLITRLLNGSRDSNDAKDTLRQVNAYCLAFLNQYLKKSS